MEFSEKVNGFLGNNGMGKSNLLDAIYVMSLTKSFTRVPDRMLIRRGETFATLRAIFERRGISEELTMGLSEGRRKSLKRGGKEYDRLSDHIGAFPLVMIAPHDIDLIRGASDERRTWMDMVISQGNAAYLDALMRYSRALEQRNSMLRDGVVDHTLYESVEMIMEMSAALIHRERQAWVEKLTGVFDNYYQAIAGDGEHAALTYQSALSGDGVTLSQLLDGARRHDEAVRHTSVGPHRDDIEMTLSGMPVRRTGSQGQCKTFTIALRLSQYDFLRQQTSLKPLLLLDDIFDKLDATRVERIMSLLASDHFGQIFVTDTNRTHLDEIMTRTGGDYKLWMVDNGEFNPLYR